MTAATHALIIVCAAILALWPAAFLVAAALHGFARRWRHVGQIAWLLPLWSIAASIGLVQFPRLLKAFETSSSAPGPTLVAITAAIFALCCAGVAWALLLRSFAGADRPGTPAP